MALYPYTINPYMVYDTLNPFRVHFVFKLWVMPWFLGLGAAYHATPTMVFLTSVIGVLHGVVSIGLKLDKQQTCIIALAGSVYFINLYSNLLLSSCVITTNTIRNASCKGFSIYSPTCHTSHLPYSSRLLLMLADPLRTALCIRKW